MEETVVPSACAQPCPGKCVINAHVRDGVIVRISTDNDSPDTPQHRQLRACVRGRSYRQRLYHPDRITHPLVRVGERGEGRFRQASWDEAIGLTADALNRVRDRDGNEALYVHFGTGHGGALRPTNLTQRLLGLFGGFLGHYNDYSLPSSALASVATYGTTTTGNSLDDLVNSRLILLWGANLAETAISTGAPWYLRRARQAGARIVCIDPVFTSTAATLADQWVPIYPGTDNALMNAMAYVLITEGLVDRAFLDTYCVGFDEAHLPAGAPAGSSYESHVLGVTDQVPKTPQWAERICGVSAETIVQLAREYGTMRPGTIIQGWGMQRQAYGEQAARGGAVLTSLVGNVGVSGGGAAGVGLCDRKMTLTPIPVQNPIAAKIPVFRWTDAVVRATELGAEDGLRGTDRLSCNIKAIFNMQSNLLINQHADANTAAARLRDERLVEFILVADHFMTSSARFADVFWPTAMFLEKYDMNQATDGFDGACFLNKAAEPPGEARSEYAILTDLAERLGLRDQFTEGRDELEWLRHLATQSGITDFDSFRKEGIYRRVHPEPHVAFAGFRRDPVAHPLATPSGKIEIYSQAAADQGHPDTVPAVPKYISGWEGRSDPLREKYPLQLLTPHPRFSTHSSHVHLPWIKEISLTAISMNPVDAQPRGLMEGDRVLVRNDRATVSIPVHITERIMPGVLSMPEGSSYSPRADGVDIGGCANSLTSLEPTPWAHANTEDTCLVDVRKEEERA